MITATDILTAVCDESLTFRTLVGVEFLRDNDGGLIFYIGNMSVVFRVRYNGKESLLKCYLVNHPYLDTIYKERYHKCELLLFNFDYQGEWLDVVVDVWREGIPLSRAIREAAAQGSHSKLRNLSHNFDTLALELLNSPWAHGDITTDNIIVGDDSQMSLIDFDALYSPELLGRACCEIGTDAYQHPTRDSSIFDEYIDDYSIALISTALHLISIEPKLYLQNQECDGLLFTSRDILDGRSELYQDSLELITKRGDAIRYRIASLLTSYNYQLAQLRDYLAFALGGECDEQPVELFVDISSWGFKSQSGEVVIPPIYDSGFDFSCSVAAVRVGSYWHYINTGGEVVLNCSHCQAIKPARNGCFRLLINDQWQEIPIESC